MANGFRHMAHSGIEKMRDPAGDSGPDREVSPGGPADRPEDPMRSAVMDATYGVRGSGIGEQRRREFNSKRGG